MNLSNYILTENNGKAFNINNESILKQLWILSDEHITVKMSIFDKFNNTLLNNLKLLRTLENEVIKCIKNKNIRYLNYIFLLIIRKRDYRHGGEGRKTLYYTLLFKFFDSLFKTEQLELVKFYMYVSSRLSNYYGCWKDLRKMIKLLKNSNKLNSYIIDYNNLQIYINYCIEAFSEQLKKDIENYNNKKQISLCCKFAPSENTDKETSRKISRLLFNTNTPDKDYRKMLTELHKYINVIEQYICNKKLNEFTPQYITLGNKRFYKHQFDNPDENWEELINKFNEMSKKKYEEVKNINEELNEIQLKIAILKYKVILSDDEQNELNELLNREKQLKDKLNNMKISTGTESCDIIKLFYTILDNIKHNKSIENYELIIETIKAKLNEITKLDALCVCDTSGSMHGQPLYAALMLTYLISSTSSELKFRNKFITFSNYPKWISVKRNDNKPPSIKDFYTTIMKNMIIENTDIQKTIDLIINSIKDYPTFNPKVIFFLTDGQFDEMTTNNNIMCKDYIKQQFEKINKHPPLCIFWNLKNCDSIESKVLDNGFIMYSGFSQKQLDNLSQGIFTLESEGKELNNLSTEDLIINFINSAFKNEIINIMKTYKNKIFFEKDITEW